MSNRNARYIEWQIEPNDGAAEPISIPIKDTIDELLMNKEFKVVFLGGGVDTDAERNSSG